MNTIPYANSLFEQPWWLDIVAPNQWDEILVSNEDGTVIGRMPYVKDGHRIVMPQLTQNLGIWILPELQSEYVVIQEIIQKIFSAFEKTKFVKVRLSPNNQYVVPFRWLGYHMEPYFTYQITDLSNCDLIYNRFQKKAKKNIRYARNKVSVFTEVNAQTLWDMLNKTFARQNRKNPMSKELVFLIVESCERNHCGQYFEARDLSGNVHSCIYLVYDEAICYYLLGASDSEFRSSGAQTFLLWEAIQFAAKHSKVFDFEGSMVEGIENFFRQFGGICTPYYEIRKGTLAEEMLLLLKPKVKRLLGYKI